MAQTLKSGKITLSTHNTDQVEIVTANKRIDINTKHKQFIKEIMAGIREGRRGVSITETLKEAPELIKTARSLREALIETADELKAAGVTITISYKGDVVLTVGAEADSTLSKLVAGTKAIEINNPIKLAEMGI